MDLKGFYQKIHDVEASIDAAYALVVSHATPDGGKAGVVSEVSRAVAARLVVEQRARLATAEEKAAYEAAQEELMRQMAEREAATRLRVAFLSAAELQQLRERG